MTDAGRDTQREVGTAVLPASAGTLAQWGTRRRCRVLALAQWGSRSSDRPDVALTMPAEPAVEPRPPCPPGLLGGPQRRPSCPAPWAALAQRSDVANLQDRLSHGPRSAHLREVEGQVRTIARGHLMPTEDTMDKLLLTPRRGRQRLGHRPLEALRVAPDRPTPFGAHRCLPPGARGRADRVPGQPSRGDALLRLPASATARQVARVWTGPAVSTDSSPPTTG